MSRRKPRHGPSRLLTPRVEERLIEATKAGVPAETAAGYAGIARSTFMLWMQMGREEEEARLIPEYVPDPTQQPYVDLLNAIIEARSHAAVKSVLQVHKAAQGGQVIERTVRTLPDGTREETVRTAPPDWRAAAWYLERQHRQQFGKEATQVEVSGPQGGPLQVGAVDVDDIAARVASNIAALAAGAAADQEEPLQLEAGPVTIPGELAS